MRRSTLLKRNLTYFWRTNLAVVSGVATAVAVLAGALLVGGSVRASLRSLFLQRLGAADYVVLAPNFFREALAEDVQTHDRFDQAFGAACPLIALEGLVAHGENGRRASGVQIYGVDERFFQFHGAEKATAALAGRDVLINSTLAEELSASTGDPILVRVTKPSAVPADSLHGRKEDRGRTLRLSTRAVLPPTAMGDFSIQLHQGGVRAAFVPLRRLQEDLEQEGRVNAILISEKIPRDPKRGKLLGRLLKQVFRLEDLEIRLRALPERHAFSLETESTLLSDALSKAAQETAAALGMPARPVLTYLANSIRAAGRDVPYSLVTAVDLERFEGLESNHTVADPGPSDLPPLVLNEWTAGDLGARPNDVISLDYYLWRDDGRLISQTSQFQLIATVKMEGAAADPDLAPEYPGVTNSASLSDWDPPFPMDLGRIRPRDEAYWDRYRTTPKAFISLEKGQELWQSRFGKLTSLRITPPKEGGFQSSFDSYRRGLRDALDPLRLGFSIFDARSRGLEASQGATDFGEYFTYFSFFLVVSALLLAALFFRLGVEQRLREIGILQSVGLPRTVIRNILLGEGAVLALAGSILGVAGALAYASLIMYGLRTWWVDAVGTTHLNLHVSYAALALGGLGGVFTALLCIAWTLRGLRPATPRSLLTGVRESYAGVRAAPRSAQILGLTCTVFALALLLTAALGIISQVLGFFAAGTLLLISLFSFQWAWLSKGRSQLLVGAGMQGISRLGFRNATYRPGRSILCIALIASATFIIVAVSAFRREAAGTTADKKSGTGGFPLLAESILPIHYDLNTHAGRENLNLVGQEIPEIGKLTFVPFRLKPGDDASCLNLYRPQNPRILGAGGEFIKSGRFSFQGSLARTPEEERNAWLLLETPDASGAIPAIADANSMTYVLHLKLGEELILDRGTDTPVRLRMVGALSDSVFQGEVLISEDNFLRLFPNEEGYRFFLLDLPPDGAEKITGVLEETLSDHGLDVVSTQERLAGFHRVENTYLSTFQTLGGLGLLLGTLGLAAVLLRNVLERRRELALLRAVGYRSADLAVMVVAENTLLLVFGLVAGTVSAFLAIAPALYSRGGQLPTAPLILLLAVLATGFFASLLATAAAIRSPLLSVLRAE